MKQQHERERERERERSGENAGPINTSLSRMETGMKKTQMRDATKKK